MSKYRVKQIGGTFYPQIRRWGFYRLFYIEESAPYCCTWFEAVGFSTLEGARRFIEQHIAENTPTPSGPPPLVQYHSYP